MDIGPIIVIDERTVAEPLCEKLESMGCPAEHFLPIKGVDKLISNRNYRSLIIEPFFFFPEYYDNMQLLHKILVDAHSKNARTLALSCQSEQDLIAQDITQGRDYDSYLLKPAKIDDIIKVLQERP
jgi:hypothetical protein